MCKAVVIIFYEYILAHIIATVLGQSVCKGMISKQLHKFCGLSVIVMEGRICQTNLREVEDSSVPLKARIYFSPSQTS